MENANWKSPRKVAEEIRDYQRKRFEDYMQMEDRGDITRSLALSALRDEVEANFTLTVPEQGAL